MQTPSQSQSQSRTSKLRLCDLPDDILGRIFHSLLSPILIAPHSRIVECCYRRALPLALTNHRMYALFHAQLDDLELWQSGRLDNRGLLSLARHSNSTIRRLILRNCGSITAGSVVQAAKLCTKLRVLDLSYHDLSDAEVCEILGYLSRSCHTLYLRGCSKISDATMEAIGRYAPQIHTLDIADTAVTDAGIGHLVRGNGGVLATLVISNCKNLTDLALFHLSHCTNLHNLTCRCLPLISNSGLNTLCGGVGRQLQILDVLDCDQLDAYYFLQSIRMHCPALFSRVQHANVEGKTVRQIVISSLSGFIFHVRGSDIHNGKSAVYFLLVDSGTSNSFRVSIGGSSLDLTNYGCILASCFGEKPNDQVKRTLKSLYGLDVGSEVGAQSEAIL